MLDIELSDLNAHTLLPREKKHKTPKCQSKIKTHSGRQWEKDDTSYCLWEKTKRFTQQLAQTDGNPVNFWCWSPGEAGVLPLPGSGFFPGLGPKWSSPSLLPGPADSAPDTCSL